MFGGGSHRAISGLILKAISIASLFVAGLYAGIRFYEAFGPLLYAFWQSLGVLERMSVTLLLVTYLGAVIAFVVIIVRNKVKFLLGVRDNFRKVVLVAAGTIVNVPLINKETRPELAEPIMKAFRSSTLVIAFNPLEGGVARYRSKIGSIKRSIVKGTPTYILNVRHSNQDMRYAEAQRKAEVNFARKLLHEIKRLHKGNFSAAIWLLGHGITSYTTQANFPKPPAGVNIILLVADPETGVPKNE